MIYRKEQVFLEAMMQGAGEDVEYWQFKLPDLSPRPSLLPPLFIMVSTLSPPLVSRPFTHWRTIQGQGGTQIKRDKDHSVIILQERGSDWDRLPVAHLSISILLVQEFWHGGPRWSIPLLLSPAELIRGGCVCFLWLLKQNTKSWVARKMGWGLREGPWSDADPDFVWSWLSLSRLGLSSHLFSCSWLLPVSIQSHSPVCLCLYSSDPVFERH